MSQIRLVIADKDALYLEKLSAYLQKNKAYGFYLELYTDKNKLVEWLSSGKRTDLLVISASLYNELAEKPVNKNILLLRDCAESLAPQNINSINKYRPADYILKEILSLCAEYIPRDINDENKNGCINLVLYADGSDALNPLAQGLAYINAVRKKKVYYMSLDEFPNTNSWLNSNNTKGLSEMLYYVKSQKENLSLKAEACTSCDTKTGIYFMKGHNNPEDVKSLNEGELTSLLKAVQRSLPYDEIIISRAFITDQITLWLLNAAGRVFVSALNYKSSIDRLNRIVNHINRFENVYGLKEKLVFCINSISDNQLPINLDNPNLNIVNLPYLDNRNAGLFPLSNEYLTTLEAAVNNPEV
ncbi:MAG TPA: hypothetical protein GXZ22_01745 [Clostridiaceae bacterium]|nr:hypothetical protein [Clostridiaceae bacterium]